MGCFGQGKGSGDGVDANRQVHVAARDAAFAVGGQ